MSYRLLQTVTKLESRSFLTSRWLSKSVCTLCVLSIKLMFKLQDFSLIQASYHNAKVQTSSTVNSVQVLLNKYWPLFASDPPKGFGKFFGEEGSKNKPPTVDSDKPPPQPPNENDAAKGKSDDKKTFEFKYSFGGNNSGDGKKAGNKGSGDREKWFTTGMIASALTIAAISYYNYSYEEISWKDLKKYYI